MPCASCGCSVFAGRGALGAQLLGLGAVERIEQRRHRQLAAPVDADIDVVLGVELEIEPGAAIGDDARGEEILARGMASCPCRDRRTRPGERCICETMTRSVPLMMKVPFFVISGMSPM